MISRPVNVILVLSVLICAACSSGDGSKENGARNTLASATSSPSPRPTPSPTPLPPLTLAGIFPPRDLSALKLDPSRVRTVIATGDVIPARYVDVTIRDHGDDFLYPVAATKDITSAADLTVINLEAPLIDDCAYHDSGLIFCGRPGFVAALQAAGVDVVTLENNHIANHGEEAVHETIQHLEAGGLHWADRDTPAIMEVRGLKFGFLAYNGVEQPLDLDLMVAQIKALRPKVDVLAVSVHWGQEYVRIPSAVPPVANDNPVEIAHLAVDAGADILIGNHPHWVQAVEIYKGKFIAYAHGNFIFDQMWSYETRVGVLGKYTFYDDKLVGVEFIPTIIENYAQPRLLEGEERQAALDAMKVASEELVGGMAALP
ncbi:MAG: CapA family protein [Chloroflexi bacterium]|nr:MAG: CapA family protein [Chloroflexota bacterium]